VAIEPEPLQSPRIKTEEIFGTVIKTKLLVERWRVEYNHLRPHSLLGYRPPGGAVPAQEAGGHYSDECEGVRFRSTVHLRSKY
jgi:hypothetical protein